MYGIIVSFSMLFYVMTKEIFNMFARVKMPMDIWSKIDVFCACSTMISQIMTSRMEVNDVIDIERKYIYNYLMVITILATWMRLIGFMFVLEDFSKLIMTIVEMLSGATTFLLICLFYLVVMATIAMCLFQESSIQYSNIFNAIRTMFDAMIAMY